MTLWGHRVSAQFRLGLLTLAPILIVAALLALLPPDGSERAEWAQFIGRFHPLAVHFPIALILLVPILELAGLSPRFSYLRSSAGFVLGLATVSATVAAILGWCLGRTGGYSGPLVTQHMWGGISLAAVCWVCWILRSRSSERGLGFIYGVALAAGVGLVAWTGYRGGQLSLGEDHLTEYMPGRLRQALGLANVAASSANAGPTTFYGARVEPVFEARCVTCHGPSKHRANLRLDSYRGVMRGGKNGPVILAGNVQGSDLFRRITLPPGHDDFMPKEGKRPLSADQVKLIELWIGAGASDTLPVDAIKGAPADSTSPTVAEVTFAEIDPAAVTKLRAGIAPTVAQLQKQYPEHFGIRVARLCQLTLECFDPRAEVWRPRFRGPRSASGTHNSSGLFSDGDYRPFCDLDCCHEATARPAARAYWNYRQDGAGSRHAGSTRIVECF